MGLIASEATIWQAIIASGRIPSDKIVDQSAPSVYGGSDWQVI